MYIRKLSWRTRRSSAQRWRQKWQPKPTLCWTRSMTNWIKLERFVVFFLLYVIDNWLDFFSLFFSEIEKSGSRNHKINAPKIYIKINCPLSYLILHVAVERLQRRAATTACLARDRAALASLSSRRGSLASFSACRATCCDVINNRESSEHEIAFYWSSL